MARAKIGLHFAVKPTRMRHLAKNDVTFSTCLRHKSICKIIIYDYEYPLKFKTANVKSKTGEVRLYVYLLYISEK